jgi:hypothetical protein
MSAKFKGRGQEQIVNLTSREKMDYPFLVAAQINTIQQAILRKDLTIDNLSEAVLGLVHLIPSSWKDKDEKFQADYKKALVETEVDIREEFAGVQLSHEWHEAHGVPSTKKEDKLNYFLLFQAAINLLYRRGMIVRTEKTEKTSGRRVRKKIVPTPHFDSAEVMAQFAAENLDTFIIGFKRRNPEAWNFHFPDDPVDEVAPEPATQEDETFNEELETAEENITEADLEPEPEEDLDP